MLTRWQQWNFREQLTEGVAVSRWEHYCVCLLLFYTLATFKGISWWAPTFDSVHSWWLYSVAPLREQATSAMNWYPTHSHYPDGAPTSSCHTLVISNAWLHFWVIDLIPTGWKLPRFGFPYPSKREMDALPIWPSQSTAVLFSENYCLKGAHHRGFECLLFT